MTVNCDLNCFIYQPKKTNKFLIYFFLPALSMTVNKTAYCFYFLKTGFSLPNPFLNKLDKETMTSLKCCFFISTSICLKKLKIIYFWNGFLKLFFWEDVCIRASFLHLPVISLTISWSSTSVKSYSLIATMKMMAVTPSKQWIHFFLSDLWPPTSNIL